LTYCANWWNDFDQVSIWGDLDLVAVDFFFPLATDRHPTRAAVAQEMRQCRDRIEAVSRRWNKPYLLAEIGWRSADHALAQPWDWTAEAGDQVPNPALQSEAYGAVVEVFAGRSWFEGLFWWIWYAETSEHAGAAVDFSPRGKPAAEVIRDWFR
jgi:hypothetical protein